MSKFPHDFLWGVATSSYQIEGAAYEDGKGLSIWDTFCKVPGAIANGDHGDVANDHYHLYKSDVALMKEMGAGGYRFSFSWPRMFPNGDGVKEERGFAFYDRLIDELLEKGIAPWATLYHWDLPEALSQKGGWTNRDIVNRFGEYANEVGERFGDRIKNFFPINEPWVVAWLGYGIGIHAPGRKSRSEAFAAAHHTVLSHYAAFDALKALGLNVGPVQNQSEFVPDDSNNEYQKNAADILDAVQNRFWMDAYYKGTYPELIWQRFGKELEQVVKPGDLRVVDNDFLGLNYYNNSRVGDEDKNSGDLYAVLLDVYADTSSRGPVTEMGWQITPEGLTNLPLRWHQEFGSKIPAIYITENGCAYGDLPDANGEVKDVKRIDYLQKHLSALGNAIEKGAPVKGYFQWSLMDNFEWALGYEKRFGIVYVDFKSQQRIIKNSGKWYMDVIKNNGAGL
jgi:beta-glucosidase